MNPTTNTTELNQEQGACAALAQAEVPMFCWDHLDRTSKDRKRCADCWAKRMNEHAVQQRNQTNANCFAITAIAMKGIEEGDHHSIRETDTQNTKRCLTYEKP
jgi:hypothetical protein